MGGKNSADADLDEVIIRSIARCGTIPVSGRYHRPPRVLDEDYELQKRVLGSGYNGQVFLATDRRTAMQYAVKAFKLHGVGSEKKQELVDECEIFLCLDHPHVVRLSDVYEDKNHLNLVMECMTGGELLQRVLKLKHYTEKSACEASRQMLLSINYLHAHQVVHRDIKLENFLYDKPGSDHLKLIDFGFSKFWNRSKKMDLSCGTLSYVAPEVLKKSYTDKCDMWSFGVVVFVLLSGYMPFAGDEADQAEAIRCGSYTMKKPVWKQVSRQGADFVKRCLITDAEERLSSSDALHHPWIAKVQDAVDAVHIIDSSTIDSLQAFARASHFRRACMSMMAWCLSNDERARLRDLFLEMDTDKTGTVSLAEFKQVLEDQFHVEDSEVIDAFEMINAAHTEGIRYTEFLAAMVSSRIAMHEDLLYATFHRFDTHNSGFITAADLRTCLGETLEGQEADNMLAEADTSHDGKISYQEFIVYLRSQDGDHSHAEVAHRLIDTEMKRPAEHPDHRAEHRTKAHREGALRSKITKPGAAVTQVASKQQCCILM